jgi:glutathione S-transferase
MKLYWSPRSPFVRKVMVCAHEIGIADRIENIYTLVSASAVNADMMRVNPLGRIPALEVENGKILYDSVVICDYLDTRYGEARLFPRDEASRWDALRRHALANGMLEILVQWRSERSRPPAQQSPDTLRAFESKIASGLSAADAEPASSGAVDIGHVTLGVVLGYLDFRYAEIDWRARHPQLAQWFESFVARASMKYTAHRDERAS